MIQTKLTKVEKELQEFKDICAGQKETIKNLYEQKKEVVYVDKTVPGKLKDTDLAAFEQKCDTLSQVCDTMDLIMKKEAGVMTDVSGDITAGSGMIQQQQQ